MQADSVFFMAMHTGQYEAKGSGQGEAEDSSEAIEAKRLDETQNRISLADTEKWIRDEKQSVRSRYGRKRAKIRRRFQTMGKVEKLGPLISGLLPAAA